MTKCPVCDEEIEESRRCPECNTDIGSLLDIRSASSDHLQKALKAYERGDFHEMFFHAKRAESMCHSRYALKVLACASLLINRFDLGYMLWRRYYLS